MTSAKHHQLTKVLEWLVLSILSLILLVTLWQIYLDFRAPGIHPIRRSHILFGRPQNPNQIMPSQIMGWMTFHYLNTVFKLPDSYLENTLGIKDSRYPNISVDSLAKELNVSSNREIVAIQTAIDIYKK